MIKIQSSGPTGRCLSAHANGLGRRAVRPWDAQNFGVRGQIRAFERDDRSSRLKTAIPRLRAAPNRHLAVANHARSALRRQTTAGVSPTSQSNATGISHPFGPTYTHETAATERCPGLGLSASDHWTPRTALRRPVILPLPGGAGRLPLPWARERVAEGRVRDQRGKLTAAAEGGRGRFPQGLDSAFLKWEENWNFLNKINRFPKTPGEIPVALNWRWAVRPGVRRRNRRSPCQ